MLTARFPPERAARASGQVPSLLVRFKTGKFVSDTGGAELRSATTAEQMSFDDVEETCP